MLPQRVFDAPTPTEHDARKQLLIRSAIAQAEQASVDPGRLFVSESRVDEGPTLKRFQEKDRGRSHPIHKRTCHLHVSVDAR